MFSVHKRKAMVGAPRCHHYYPISPQCAWLLILLWVGLLTWGYVINVDPVVHHYNVLESKQPHPILSRLRGSKKSPRMLVSLWNLFHVYIYICVTFTLCVAFPHRWVEVVVGLFFTGIVFEILEIPFGCHDWTDVLYNSTGILLGVLLWTTCVRRHPRHRVATRHERVARLLFLLLFLGVFALVGNKNK